MPIPIMSAPSVEPSLTPSGSSTLSAIPSMMAPNPSVAANPAVSNTPVAPTVVTPPTGTGLDGIMAGIKNQYFSQTTVANIGNIVPAPQ